MADSYGRDDGEQTDDSTPKKSGYVAPVGPAETTEAQKEANQIKQHQKKYDAARQFDKNYRKQIAKDRRYAAGTWDINWAVSANIVGYVIDILTSILYARDPDLQAAKAPQVDDESPSNINIELWARTLTIVISMLWQKAPLKTVAKQQVRGALTTSAGWIKANLLTDKVPQPKVQKAMNDALERKEQIKAMREMIGNADAVGMSDEQMDYEDQELDNTIATSKSQIDAAVRKTYVVEYMPAQTVQLSLDVAREEDYLNCDWITFETYVLYDECLEGNPRLKAEDITKATKYYQKKAPDLAGQPLDNDLPQGEISSEAAELYSTTQGDEEVAFVKVIEKWCRKDGYIYTWIEGVQRWAKEPFEPNYATSRFYPCFRLAFFEVDGERHAQSIPYRISKLQDEYSCARSNFRLARERSIPGVIFDATNITDEDAAKLAASKSQELIAIKPVDPTKPISNSFAQKPVAPIDPRVFDTTPILQDINRITGVQEALQGAAQGPKTATEAQLEQLGMNARSTSDRDALEWMLTDFATYTGECAVQGLTTEEVQAMVGSSAFWPEGEGVNADVFNRLVNLTIKAGSTGKPNKQGDQQAWGVVLPLIEKVIGNIMAARAQGNLPLAKALEELVKETMRRMGDDTDVERFIPQVQKQPPVNNGPPPPNVSISLKGVVPQEDANAIAARAAGLPPVPAGAPPSPGAAPAGASGPAGAAPGATPPGQQPGPQGPPPGAVPPVHPQGV